MTIGSPAEPTVEAPTGRLRGIARRINVTGSGLARDTAWSLGHDVTFIVVTTLSFLVIGRHLGPTVYGAYVAIYGIVGPIACITMSGVSLAAVQHAVRDGDDPVSVLRSGLTLCLGMGLIGTGAATALAWMVTKGNVPMVSIVLIAASELVFAAVITVSAAAVQASSGFAAATKVRIVLAPGKLLMLVALLITDSVSVPGVAVGSVILYGSWALILLVVVMPRLGVPPSVGRPERHMTVTSLLLGFPISAAAIQSDGDKSVLAHFGFVRDGGLYGAATKVIALGLVPLRALDSAAFMRFVRFDPNAAGQHLSRAKRYCAFALVLNIGLAAFLYVASPHFSLVLGTEFEGSESMIRWLLLYLPFLALSGAPLNGLLGLGQVRRRAVISTVSAALSLTIYIVAIPSMSWKGAIVGTVVGEAFLATAGWIALIRAQAAHDAALS